MQSVEWNIQGGEFQFDISEVASLMEDLSGVLSVSPRGSLFLWEYSHL